MLLATKSLYSLRDAKDAFNPTLHHVQNTWNVELLMMNYFQSDMLWIIHHIYTINSLRTCDAIRHQVVNIGLGYRLPETFP